MDIQEQKATINIGLEDLLQVLELANRLVSLNFASRTEANFVKSISQNVLNVLQASQKAEAMPGEQNNKVDETTKKE